MSSAYSANCFLNSLLREWPNHKIITCDQGSKVVIHLDDEKTLEIPLLRHSSLGRHKYTHNNLIRFFDRKTQEISFSELVDLLSSHLSQEFLTDTKQLKNFKNRVAASDETIELALNQRATDVYNLYHSRLSFIESEQALFIGHNFHPTPKSRDEFSLSDLKSYSPELAASFPIQWWVADPSIFFQSTSKVTKHLSLTTELARRDVGDSDNLENHINQGFVPFPVHPWQSKVLKQNPLIQSYMKANQLIDLGDSKHQWQPTSSLRTLYCESMPYMLKFSMSVKLTNSIRHLLPREVERGQQLQDVLATPLGQKFNQAHPGFCILHEPAYTALKGADGEPMIETIAVCRDNPFIEGKEQNTQVLATLTQDPLLGALTPLQSLLFHNGSLESPRDKASKWFTQYLKTVVTPILDAQMNYGILLGAHQQNVVVALDQQGYPQSAFFRDCQGTGYSELGYQNFRNWVPSVTRENGNVLPEKMANYLVAYYLILNSTFNVITALTNQDWISESELLCMLKDLLEGLRAAKPLDPSCLDYLLASKELMHKGNFLCSFKCINENTTSDPLAIYTPVVNPLLGLDSSKQSFDSQRSVYATTAASR